MNWLTNYVRPKIRALYARKEVPDNLWHKCPSCESMLFHRELEENLHVCQHCGFHMRLDPVIVHHAVGRLESESSVLAPGFLDRALEGITKHTSERVVSRYRSLFGLDAVSVRLANVFGPMERITPGYVGATELREVP